MTLILAAAIGGKCNIITGDTRRVLDTYWEEEATGKWGINRDNTTTDIVTNKVFPLSNYVTCGVAGNAEISRHIVGSLKRKMSKNDGILSAGLKLESIIKDMRKIRDEGKNVPYFYNFLDSPDNFGIVLNGFTNKIEPGKSFFTFYISGFDEDVHAQEIKDNEYSYIFWAPFGDYALNKDEYMSVNFNSFQSKSTTLTNHCLKIHALISSLQPDQVSHLCDYRAMEWKESPKRSKTFIKESRIDVSKYYKELGLT